MKINQKIMLLVLSLACMATTLDAAANNGAGAAPACALKALAKPKNIVHQLRDGRLGIAPFKLDSSYLQGKIIETMLDLTSAQANHDDKLARRLESQLERLNRTNTDLIEKHQAAFRAAFKKANATFSWKTTLAEGKALLATIPTEKMLDRMALCFAWYEYFPGDPNIDDIINLREIITEPLNRSIQLNFNSINGLDNHKTIAQLIVDFVLAVIQPTKLMIKNVSGSLVFFSSSLTYLHASSNPALTSLAGLNAPNLTTLSVYSNARLNSFANFNAPRLTRIEADGNPALTSLAGINAPNLIELYANDNPALTSLAGINAPNLTTLEAYDSPALVDLGDDFYAPLLPAAMRAELDEQIATNRARIALEKQAELNLFTGG